MMFETERLLIRNFKEEDFNDVHEYSSNIDNIRFNQWGPNTPEDTKAFIAGVLEKESLEPRMHYDFVLVLKETNKVIGAIGLYLNLSYEAYIGYILNKDYWKQGYAVEAGKKIFEYGFNELNLHRIYGTCFSKNYGSKRVMEKLGMRFEGEFLKRKKGTRPFDDLWYDQKLYAILKEEFIKRGF